MVADKSCSNYLLNNLTISMGGLDYRIPQVYYARTEKVNSSSIGSKKCHLLIEPAGAVDPTDDVSFVFGLPFMRAF